MKTGFLFIQYRQDNGTSPLALEDLVPGYISTIPVVPINDGRDDPCGKIRDVQQAEEEPIFILLFFLSFRLKVFIEF